MIKPFIKWGLLNMCCIMNLVAILLIANHWFSMKTITIKIGIFTLIVLGIISTVLFSMLSLKFDIYTKVLNNLYFISFICFGLCVLSSIINIAIFKLERGSTLYDLYSLPTIFPIISSVILFTLKN